MHNIISSHNIQAYILYRGKQINIYYSFSENYQLTNYVSKMPFMIDLCKYTVIIEFILKLL